MIPLTVPEVRRLLRLLTLPDEQCRFHLRWSHWRRAHQAVARRCHIARRARAGPAGCSPPALPAPPATWVALTDERWAQVRLLLPPRVRRGRPPREGRAMLAGLLWLLRSGASWRALPERFGPWQTAYHRYRRWRAAGVWPRVAAVLQLPVATDDGAPSAAPPTTRESNP